MRRPKSSLPKNRKIVKSGTGLTTPRAGGKSDFHMPEYFREVVREEAFEDELHVLIGDSRAADEFVEAAEFVLARNPEAGLMAPDAEPVWFMPMAPIEGRQIALYYVFDETTVYLLGIRPSEAMPPRAGL